MTPDRWNDVNRVWHAVMARPEAELDLALGVDQGLQRVRPQIHQDLVHLGRVAHHWQSRVRQVGANLRLRASHRTQQCH